MTPAERRRARRAQRRAERRAFVRAHAAAGDPSELGSWAPPFVMTTNYEGYAVHAAMLHTGKVLMWGRQGAPRGDARPTHGSGTRRRATATMRSATSPRPVRAGTTSRSSARACRSSRTDGSSSWAARSWTGTRTRTTTSRPGPGSTAAIVFDPATETWTELPRPAGSNGRWYPTQVLLGDGRTLVVSGLTEDPPGGLLNDAPEIYNTDDERLHAPRDSGAATGHGSISPPVHDAGRDGPPGRPRPGRLGRSSTRRTSPTRGPTFRQLATRRDRRERVLLPDGTDGSTTVAAIGGRPSKGPPPAFNEMIDLADPTPTWSSFPALAAQRVWANTVQLPDGSMVTIGGNDMVDDSTVRARRRAVRPGHRNMAHRPEPGRDACLPLHRAASAGRARALHGRRPQSAVARRHRRGLLAAVSLQGPAAGDLLSPGGRPLERAVRRRHDG